MITTGQLRSWEKEVKETVRAAHAGEERYKNNPTMYGYYNNLALIADVQLALVQRLILQSEKQEGV